MARGSNKCSLCRGQFVSVGTLCSTCLNPSGRVGVAPLAPQAFPVPGRRGLAEQWRDAATGRTDRAAAHLNTAVLPDPAPAIELASDIEAVRDAGQCGICRGTGCPACDDTGTVDKETLRRALSHDPEVWQKVTGVTDTRTLGTEATLLTALPGSGLDLEQSRDAAMRLDAAIKYRLHETKVANTDDDGTVAEGTIVPSTAADPADVEALLSSTAAALRASDLPEAEKRRGLACLYRAHYLQNNGEQPVTAVAAETMHRLPQWVADTAEQYRLEQQFVAGTHGGTPDEVAQSLAEWRQEWLTTPQDERPALPAEWAKTYRSGHRFYWRADAATAPCDDATVYAMWRAEQGHGPNGRNENGYAFVDLETTSLDRRDGEIIEVGVVLVDRHGNVERTVSELFCPTPDLNGNVTTGATDVHGITAADVHGKPNFKDDAANIREVLNGRTIVAQNTLFDYGWLQHHFRAAGLAPLSDPGLVDTKRAAMFQQVPSANHKLQTLAEHFGEEYTDGHRALHDAEVCRRVAGHLLPNMFSASTDR